MKILLERPDGNSAFKVKNMIKSKTICNTRKIKIGFINIQNFNKYSIKAIKHKIRTSVH